ncbi:MAG: beta-phosphoglucomutase [Bacteroidetes bacterium]|nr:beta-phosphoglucomutase [Bacteroidota bacterium]
MSLELKGCLFDMDGVIVDSAVHHFVAWKRLADELSIPFTEQDNHALKGLSRVDSLEHILRMGHLQLDEKTKLKLMAQKNAWYLDLIKGMRAKDILPGARELIEELVAEGIKVGLGSSSRNAQMILDNVGLTPLFDTVVDGNHITLSKPDPEVFLKGAQALGLDPRQVVVFEDAESGVKAAKTGGFFAVGVGSEEQLGQADVVVSSMKEVTLRDLKSWVRPA